MSKGSSVTLRPVELADATVIQTLANHPDILAMTDLPNPYLPGSAELWIQNAIISRSKGQAYECVILDLSDDIVGVCGFIDIDSQENAAEMGFWLGRPYWGKGYAIAACRSLIAYGRQALGLQHVVARTLVDNFASRRILESLGFTQTALEEVIGQEEGQSTTLVHYQLDLGN